MKAQEHDNRILILGGSFAGLYTALFLDDALRRRAGPKPSITLIDKNNFLLYTAFLAEVASNRLSPLAIMPPIRRIIGRRDIAFHQTTVEDIDLEKRQVQTQAGTFDYDHLVLALGSVNNYFGNEDFRKYGFPYKTMGDALKLRNQVINLLETADRLTDPREKRRLLTFVQAGAGFTGVEVIAELREFLHSVAGRVYRNIDFERDVRLILVEGLERVLSTLPEALSREALRKFERKGIEVRLNTFVTGAGPDWVELAGEERIETETLIWVAGVQANPLVASLPLEHDRMGRVVVDEYLNVPGHPQIYALGDNAACPGEGGQPLAPTAQVAVQQAPLLARNFVASLEGQPQEPFKFHYRGDLVSIGSMDGVCCPYGLHLFGLPAWFLYRAVYWSKLPTMRNRIRVAVEWLLHVINGPSVSRLELDAPEH